MLDGIAGKIDRGERIGFDEAVALFGSGDLFGVGRLAAGAARRKNGNNAYFIVNRHINPTNICVNRCRFCAFSRSRGEEGAYELTLEQVMARLDEDPGQRYTEVHIVGGLHPDRPFAYYLEMIGAIRERYPSIDIKAFTAVEIDYFARISGLPAVTVLGRLKERGLQLMPGGGAEIFDAEVRNEICPEKISTERWLEIHEAAHRAGIKTNATMLYGHVESAENRVDHLMRLRELQDRTGGFQAFIPLAYQPANTRIGGSYSSGIDDLMTIAVSRLVLDNFDHIKAYWVMLGEKVSQLALLFGADDIDGTIIEERIAKSAGGRTSGVMARADLVDLILNAGRTPVERDGFYNIIARV
jgi:aminodeoxyfutalosine synthase